MSAQLENAVELRTMPIVLVEAKPAKDAESEVRGRVLVEGAWQGIEGQSVVEHTPAQIITLRLGTKRPVEIA